MRFLPLGDNGGELGPFQQLLAFYKAPYTKLMGNAMSYAVFLVLYTYMILFDFRFEVQLTEKIVIFWLFTMLLDIVRQVGGCYCQLPRSRFLCVYIMSVSILGYLLPVLYSCSLFIELLHCR